MLSSGTCFCTCICSCTVSPQIGKPQQFRKPLLWGEIHICSEVAEGLICTYLLFLILRRKRFLSFFPEFHLSLPNLVYAFQSCDCNTAAEMTTVSFPIIYLFFIILFYFILFYFILFYFQRLIYRNLQRLVGRRVLRSTGHTPNDSIQLASFPGSNFLVWCRRESL